MVDIVDAKTRSRMMAGIKGSNTKPEVELRKGLHRGGFRYRLHVAGLPGKPDIVLPSRRVVIFVHGCFWHRHVGCYWCTVPSSNEQFWNKKFAQNVTRDAAAIEALVNSGWRTGVVWECSLRKPYSAITIETVSNWIISNETSFASPLVRPRNLAVAIHFGDSESKS